MQRVIDTYECEWKKTIGDPVALRRFRHYINSDRPDSHVVFVDERGQPRPARPAERALLEETV
jgi:nitrite reductase (NADH) large subunit